MLRKGTPYTEKLQKAQCSVLDTHPGAEQSETQTGKNHGMFWNTWALQSLLFALGMIQRVVFSSSKEHRGLIH